MASEQETDATRAHVTLAQSAHHLEDSAVQQTDSADCTGLAALASGIWTR